MTLTIGAPIFKGEANPTQRNHFRPLGESRKTCQGKDTLRWLCWDFFADNPSGGWAGLFRQRDSLKELNLENNVAVD